MEKNETIAQSDTGQALPPIGYIGSIKIEIGIKDMFTEQAVLSGLVDGNL